MQGQIRSMAQVEALLERLEGRGRNKRRRMASGQVGCGVRRGIPGDRHSVEGVCMSSVVCGLCGSPRTLPSPQSSAAFRESPEGPFRDPAKRSAVLTAGVLGGIPTIAGAQLVGSLAGGEPPLGQTRGGSRIRRALPLVPMQRGEASARDAFSCSHRAFSTSSRQLP